MSLRVMTWNVHGCRGFDRRFNPVRIARIIEKADPDIAALQELDSERRRSGGENQPGRIAHLLDMHYAFHASVRDENGDYGVAVLSRFPLDTVCSEPLPRWRACEPRGVLWVRAHTPAGPVHVLNTHFGLRRREQERQMEALLGEEWLASAGFDGPGVVCGDFNLTRNSAPIQRLEKRLRNVQAGRARRYYATWMGLRTLDHIFVTDDFSVVHVASPRSPRVRLASDHLPLIAELRLRGNG
jgi:endonuclease/exonuclease/phosphatase family metal-dependent hydrolase